MLFKISNPWKIVVFLSPIFLVTLIIYFPGYLTKCTDCEQNNKHQIWQNKMDKLKYDELKITNFIHQPIPDSNYQIILSQQSTKPRLEVSVKKFGAVGNGSFNDTPAIQAAIDAVAKAGGGVVFFPSGTYKVRINPSTSQAITIRPNVTIQGAGNDKTMIQLADNQGSYNAILAGEKPNSDLSNFAMYDIGIDGNGSNNPVKAESDLTDDRMRYALRIFVGSKIEIARCRFKNQNNANTITVNNDSLVSDVTIKHNIFELIGGGLIDYDHSTIYSHGKNIEISHNSFSSRNGAGTNGARTAIEIHGDKHTVKNNIINGFTNGINVTGFATSSNNQIITDNTIKDAYNGIVIWSYLHQPQKNEYALDNILISDNKITLNIDGWRKLWGETPSSGISLEPSSDAPFTNLNIVNNEISFTNFIKKGNASDSLANGVRIWRSDFPNIESQNILISGNNIKNSLAAGIYISTPINRGEISQNIIVNPGRSNGDFHNDYRAAVIIDGVFDRVNINENFLADHQTNNTLKGGIISFIKCVKGCQFQGNSLYVKSGAKFPVIKSNSN
ncbi:glycosyl hydrolase family 28-related protein [Anabaena sp. UHCC 0399]|uniref:glycosyl hydrolase family 28-related protein n=1 Tax=Anabaena sp. UHCC 0399 TaxID=3110238 RepID=UPI002B1FD3CF|nr:glycosyl hydrolase family 28-related protein [Anabaena sp. UHCC 0399]MEA5567722.1 glycosyl hydrolase family 28-related protein [Anabaena sp. UHCC 0399]